MTGKFVREAINTMNASWVEIKCARYLGKRTTVKDDNALIVLSTWKGKRYFIDRK
jgi:hypothetical protein